MVSFNLSFELWMYTKVCLFQINMLENIINTSNVSTNSQPIIKETKEKRNIFQSLKLHERS